VNTEATNETTNELSTDINVITAEINAYQRVAGEAIFEIGRRLKYVKENDLAHGEYTPWLEKVGIDGSTARRFVKVYEEFSDESKRGTYHGLGLRALYEIATLPPEQREAEHTTTKGETKTPSEMTVRELQELNRQLKQAEERAEAEQRERERLERENEELANREPEVIKEYIVKDTPELRDRSFDTPYGVKLLDEFYNAMDELSEWQKKYAWITSDNEQLKTFVSVDDDMKEEFRKNLNMWRTLSEVFDERSDGVIDAEIIEII